MSEVNTFLGDPMAITQMLDQAFGAPVRQRQRPLDLSRCVHPADWAQLPETLRARFTVRHEPIRYAATMRFERSAVGAIFALLAKPFKAPLPPHHQVDLPVVVDVHAEGDGVVWSRQLGGSGVVRSVKTAGPAGSVIERTDGGLGMLLDVAVDGAALVFTSRAFFLSVGQWRVPIPAWITPGRCRVEHRAVDAERFRFTLTMTHPLWGTTFRQTGLFSTLEILP